MIHICQISVYTPEHKKKHSTWQKSLRKIKLVFQLSIFWCKLLVSGRVNSSYNLEPSHDSQSSFFKKTSKDSTVILRILGFWNTPHLEGTYIILGSLAHQYHRIVMDIMDSLFTFKEKPPIGSFVRILPLAMCRGYWETSHGKSAVWVVFPLARCLNWWLKRWFRGCPTWHVRYRAYIPSHHIPPSGNKGFILAS